MDEAGVKKKIKFNFQPYKYEALGHVIEKADAEGGPKRRYLRGVSSGIKVDLHEERMTEDCIKDFCSQANTGDILLFPHIHNVKTFEDIGILTKGEITPDGNWMTEYRLYDQADGMGAGKLEKIDTIWKQLNGLPPYKKPMQKGFSIEGYIPDDGILSAEKDALGQMRKRTINRVVLDGVVLVPRPAYQDSVAHSIYKALGELPPWQEEKIRKSLHERIQSVKQNREMRNSFYDRKYELNDTLESIIEEIMRGETPDKERQLSLAFEEYRDLMVELIMASQELFQPETGPVESIVNAAQQPGVVKSKLDYYMSIYRQVNDLIFVMKSRRNKHG